jgi:hypothetical protein
MTAHFIVICALEFLDTPKGLSHEGHEDQFSHCKEFQEFEVAIDDFSCFSALALELLFLPSFLFNVLAEFSEVLLSHSVIYVPRLGFRG